MRIMLAMFRNHPRGLLTCFATELWERFSYYGMRALLIFFLTQHFLFSDRQSYLIYGAYGAMVNMMAVVGGAVADRYLGARKAITLGAILLVLGHFGMIVEGPPASRALVDGVASVVRDDFYLSIFYLSLASIITGVGFIKTNTATLVSSLYPPGDPRRDAGFTIYYMGVNIGGAVAPLLCGWIGQTYGWRYGFGLAGIGMLLGLAVFLRGQKHLHGLANPPPSARLQERIFAGLRRESLIYVGAVGLVFLVWLVMRRQQVIGMLLSTVGVVVGSFLLYYAFARCTREERQRLIACSVLIVFTLGFWAFYEQMGSSLSLFTDRYVDRRVLGHEIPASMFQGLGSLFVILLAPLFGLLWVALARRGREPSTAIKFSLAIAQLAAAFALLSFGTTQAGADGKVALGWLVLNFLLLVSGELCLVPVGISMVTRLAPQRIVGFMMGCFIFAYAASSFISGLIAQLTSVEPAAGGSVSAAAALDSYSALYSQLAVIALAIMLLLLMLAPWLRRLAHEHSISSAGAEPPAEQQVSVVHVKGD
jgi:proton-dependent oligopeptide transporter, POT family